jgi:hypothetical protein
VSRLFFFCFSFCFSLDHTQTHTTLGRTPLDEGSARRRDLDLATQTLYKTNIYAPSGIRTHDPSKRSAADLRIRPHDHWDRPYEFQFFKSRFRHCYNYYCSRSTWMSTIETPHTIRQVTDLRTKLCKWRQHLLSQFCGQSNTYVTQMDLWNYESTSATMGLRRRTLCPLSKTALCPLPQVTSR